MLTTYTKSQLLAQWRLRRGLELLRADVTVEYDGIDRSVTDEAEVLDWWAYTTANAPLDLLEPQELSARCTITAAGGGSDIKIPATTGCRRIVTVKLSGWEREARLVAPDSPEARLQEWEYTQAGIESPVAVVYSPRHIRCYPAGEDIITLTGISDGDGETFTFDNTLLQTMATFKTFNHENYT